MGDQWVYSGNGTQRFNATLLDQFNYTIYSNWTLSNVTKCYLAFGIFQPTMLPNGTVTNGTSCEYPYYPPATRGIVGLVMGCVCCIYLVLTLVCLRKHGRSFLPQTKRFKWISRRWSYYWMSITCVVGIVSGFMSIDIDRNYIQGTALVISDFFYMLLLPTTLAAIWEMVRHWSSFNERRIVDDDPFAFRQDDRRSKIEFYTPLVFYLFDFMVFFMSAIRNWNPIKRDDKSSITDARFKASAVFALVAWLVIVAFYCITRYHYRPHAQWHMVASIVVIVPKIGYNIAAACIYSIAPIGYHTKAAWIYPLGWVPTLLVLTFMIYRGYVLPNDDREIIRLRRQRTQSFNTELKETRRESRARRDSDFKSISTADTYRDSPTSPKSGKPSIITRERMSSTSTATTSTTQTRKIKSMLDV